MHATIDFETYSEAGFVFNKHKNKWGRLLNANHKGLQCVGAAAYAKHPSTEILSLAYKLPDQEVKLWTPEQPFPPDLSYFLVLALEKIEAWNVSFERWIWEEVGVKRYGFPSVSPETWHCAAAKSRAFSLPGSLSDAGRVLQTEIQKDKDGTRLLNKFSMPRNPTIKNPRLRITPQEDIEEAKLLYEYNKTDVKSEIELSEIIPDLSSFELKVWQCDLEINHRGVQIDTVSVLNCINIIQQAHAKYNAELPKLTNGLVTLSSQTARMKKWMKTLGVEVISLDKENVEELIKNPLLLPQIRRVLEIRQLIGSAAVKKLYAMLNQCTSEGRLHNLFIYHSARTGRAAGMGVQPQNLPRGQEGFDVDAALQVISTGSLDRVESMYGNATAAVSNCLRGMFIARPGYELVGSDYSAIEAVVLAELARESWRQEVFRTHGKIYEMSGSLISGMPLQEILEFKEKTGKHHETRKLGKVAELACFAPDTQVLTDSGYRRIADVSLNDKLWDGIQWVTHGGLIAKGERMTLNLDGVRMTPNHPISLGHCWKGAKLLALNKNTLIQALAIGSVNLPIKATEEEAKKGIGSHFVNVLAEISQRLRIVISEIKDQPGVIYVLKRLQKTRLLNEAFKKCSDESMTLSPVYDIVNAGANHRFTIKTDSGHLIVHNSGYGGWIGAWHNFGADEFMSEEEIKNAILAWRAASPAIVEFWGGQSRYPYSHNIEIEYFGVEGAAIQAMLYPGIAYSAGEEFDNYTYPVVFVLEKNDTLCAILPSGRKLIYHKPRLDLSTRRPGTYELSYEGWNTNPKNGAPGWIRQSTYGGKLVENITQAVARDILANAIVNLEDAGFAIVLHVHDEIVAEVPQCSRRLEEFEQIMSTMPSWAEGWPVIAKGGWIGKRYCK